MPHTMSTMEALASCVLVERLLKRVEGVVRGKSVYFNAAAHDSVPETKLRDILGRGVRRCARRVAGPCARSVGLSFYIGVGCRD